VPTSQEARVFVKTSTQNRETAFPIPARVGAVSRFIFGETAMQKPQLCSTSCVSPASILEAMMRSDFNQWSPVVSRVRNPATARLIVQLLDGDPHLRQHRIGTYLAACETLERQERRYARAFRVGQLAGSAMCLTRQILQKVALATKAVSQKSWPRAVQPVRSQVCINRQTQELEFPVIFDPFSSTKQ
jgi:hypothetical protein